MYLIMMKPGDPVWYTGWVDRYAGEVDGAASVHVDIRPAQDLRHRIFKGTVQETNHNFIADSA